MSTDPLKDLADHLGITVEEIMNMTWVQLAGLRDEAQRKVDQANADIAWADAALTAMATPCTGCGRPADGCSWSQNPAGGRGDCCWVCDHIDD
jgi:hypothetical protein